MNPDLHKMNERQIVERIVAEFHKEIDEAEIVLPEGGTTKLLVVYGDDIREVAQRIVYGREKITVDDIDRYTFHGRVNGANK